MRKRKGHGDYDFEGMEVVYGGAVFNVNGTAQYEIEDHGIGRYEYWGSNESDHAYCASFYSADIKDIVMEERLEYGTQNLKDEDMISIAELIVEQLNEDSDLCNQLAEDNIDEQE